MPRSVNVDEAKTKLSELAERAAAGEEIVIARAGRPTAKLGSLRQRGEGAQAHCEDLTIVTNDRAFEAHQIPVIWT